MQQMWTAIQHDGPKHLGLWLNQVTRREVLGATTAYQTETEAHRATAGAPRSKALAGSRWSGAWLSGPRPATPGHSRPPSGRPSAGHSHHMDCPSARWP